MGELYTRVVERRRPGVVVEFGAGRRIDLTFIDAIHTPESVVPQREVVVARSRPGALVILDDVNLSAAMGACPERIARKPRFVASARLGRWVGIVELTPGTPTC